MAIIAFAEQVLTNTGTDAIISDANETDLHVGEISQELHGGAYLQIDTMGVITTEDVSINESVYISQARQHEVFVYDGIGWSNDIGLYPNNDLYPRNNLYPTGYANLELYGITITGTPAVGDRISVFVINEDGALRDISNLQDSVTIIGEDIFNLREDVNENTAQRELTNKYIIIDPTIPEISVQAEKENPVTHKKEKNEVAILYDQVQIRTTTQEDGTRVAAYFSKDQTKTDNAVVQNLYPRVEYNGDVVGELAWIARSNGHLSLKRAGGI